MFNTISRNNGLLYMVHIMGDEKEKIWVSTVVLPDGQVVNGEDLKE